ncbi:MAG: hypothetical protein LCH30_10765, partial [Proteobacteria bacterium]|nr:hypothetical protein [Pseudomonadota bacterium]
MPLIFSDTEKRNYSLLAEDNITKSRVFGLHATHGHHRDYPDFASCLNSYCLVSSYLNLSKLDLDNSAHQNLLVLSQKYLLNTEAPQTFESLSIPDQLNLLRLIDHSLKPSNGMKTSEILDWAALASTPYGPASLGFTVLSKFAAYHEKNTNPEVPDFSFLQKFDSIIFTNPKFLSSIILDINQNSLRTAISTYTYNLIAQEELAAKKSAFPSTEQVAPSNFGLPNFKTDRRTLDSENVFNEASNFAPETVLQMAETKNMVDSLSQTVEAHSELVDTNLEKLDIAEKNAMSSTEILSLCLTGAKQIASLYVGFQQEKKAHKEFRQANEKVLQHLKKMHQQYGIKIQVEEIQAIYRNTPNNPLPSLVQLIHQSALESSKNAQKTFLNLMKEITAFKQDIKDIFIKKESFSQKIESLQSLQLKIARFIKSQDYSSLPIQLSQVCNLTAGMVAA